MPKSTKRAIRQGYNYLRAEHRFRKVFPLKINKKYEYLLTLINYYL